MENTWTYKDYKIKEGLKPGAKHFQYFYVVSEGNKKKCNYCVWIEDNALPRFDRDKDFNKIVSSRKKEWNKWVKDKIDGDDFRSLVLKFDEKGQKEINLAEMEEHLSME
jgi:chemotaxis regulatin CheY-phosphate phosphatase CheZ